MRAAVSAVIGCGAILAAACVSPDYPEGLACSAEGTCPPGQTCQTDGICRSSGGGGPVAEAPDAAGGGTIGETDAAPPVGTSLAFEPAKTFDMPGTPRALAIGGLAPGRTGDVAVGSSAGVQLFRTGGGTLEEEQFLPADTAVLAVRLGDQGNGTVIAVAVLAGGGSGAELRVWRDIGIPDTFESYDIGPELQTPLPANTGLAFADFDGNGFADVAAYVPSRPPEIAVLLNDGEAFTPAPTIGLDGADAPAGAALVATEFAGELPDLFTADGDGRGHVLLNAGKGAFSDVLPAGIDLQYSRLNAMAAGDLDGDGDVDGVALGDPSGPRVIENDGSATGGTVHLVPTADDTPDTAIALAVGDLDRDGRADLVLHDRIFVHPPGGDASDLVAVGQFENTPTPPSQAAIADLNGDSLADVAYVTDEGVHVMFQIDLAGAAAPSEIGARSCILGE